MNSSLFIGSLAAAIGFFTFFTKFRFQQDNKVTKSSNSLSLPSPPTSVSRIWKHHVFPSFHGADVRTTVLSHILESFRRKGINTFIDNEIERSKSIGHELVEAIKGSKIAIILLSKNYASSSWCLDELAEIMKCKEESNLIVMTIFYEVDPTDIKKQTGDFGKAFRKTCKGKTKEHTERWRKALEDVATIAGEHSCKWNNEAAMIEKIATDVSNILNNSTPSRDFDGLVGMRTHMEEMKELLRLDLDEEVRMIGIWGPPGIGKTTIARVLFNQVSSRFQLGAIMVNIKGCYPRPCLDEYDAQLQLQRQMLSQIINQKDIQISHLGVAEDRLKDKKVLLVLDEVDQLGQLDALAKEIQWFGPGSRIIITAEDLRVLNAHRIHHIYKVKFPSSNEAFQIFCTHAFGQKHPDDGFFELAWEVTYLAGKLPLGLKVLGSAMRGMSKQEWKRTLPRLKTHLVGDIGSIIKFSYDALCDEDKDLFLYIACLLLPFMGSLYFLTTHKVEEVLANKFLDVRQGLHVLAQKSLISIENDWVFMHTLLQQFGRETSRKQFLHGFAKHQLLVNARDICEVLSDDTTDGRRFIGIDLDLSEIEGEMNISEKAIERLHDFQFVRIRGNERDRVNPKRLHSLLYHSQKIRSLNWKYFQNKYLLSNFNPESLVELNMQGSKLEKLWEGTKPLTNLKWMYLSDSTGLKELPDLSTATKLEVLFLGHCSSLVELPSTIGNAINLQILNLSYCSSLLEIPSSIGNAINLQKLDLSYCTSLLELPSSIGNAINLQKVFLRGCSSLVELPSSIGNAINLQRLNLQNCSSLLELPSSIGNVINLQRLNLQNCSSLLELPSSIGNVINLQRLNLSYCSSLLELPSSIGNIINLQELNLSHCSSLRELPFFIGNVINLQKLDLTDCLSLVQLPSTIGNAINLQTLNLRNCSSLLELPSSIGNAINLQELDLSYCSSLLELPSSIGNVINLQKVFLTGCSSLVELSSSIGNAINLQKVFLTGCSSLVELPSSIGNAVNLPVLDLSDCSSLLEIPSFIGNAINLQKLDLKNCLSLVKLPSSIGNAINLRRLNLRNCSSLLELPSSIGNAINLQELDLSYCLSLLELPSSIGNAINIQKVFLRGCSSLVELPSSIMNIKNLEELDLKWCSNLVKLPFSLGNATNLQKLSLNHCRSMEKIPSSIDNMTNLQELDLSDCSSLVKLPSSINAPNLHRFILKNCSRDVELPVLENATNLRKLDLRNCSSLQELPPSIGTATNLQELVISGCSSLVRLPSSIGDLINLERFCLGNCSSLVELPSSIGNLQKLRMLTMCGCSKLEALPTNINLKSLYSLDLTDCSQLKFFPEISTNISNFKLTGTAIKEVPLSIRSWSLLSYFKMSYFESLKEFPHALDIITEMDLVNEDIKEVPPWVKGMSRLHKLRLYNCNSLVSLPQLPDSLSYLVAENCQSLERLDCSFNFPNICLQFVNCVKLNQEAKNLIMNTSTREHAILPGIRVPSCFNHRATNGGSVTIKLNESPLPPSLRFKACFMLLKDEEGMGDNQSRMSVYIDIMDKQKGLKVRCTPRKKLIYRLLTEHIYTFDVKAEEVTSTELVFQFKTRRRRMMLPNLKSKWKIGECGLLQIKKEKSEDRDEKNEESEN